ncbi:hypothetical protein BCR33DRAFT_719756 [Rhizoclosmatium globosum]|uniref:GATOR2 complex protein MIO zinc-ribbon like domain-containing protein n=1 Tax=Rhizoclosmatium globosum TaxID=329046 RepID=A0A1Y2BYV4_9FUNG|nr:hypothetical protein BCR33DRAFT_719756 [Rhizoclosmatium globosum]|eukprot:ORY39952.1 hypothetical protein BCR33DRAFT_719756 [Rhizoclosmatium globosum]
MPAALFLFGIYVKAMMEMELFQVRFPTPTTTPAVMGYTIGQESSYSIPTPPPAVSSFQSASAFPTTDPSQTTRTIPILVQERRLKAASTSSLSAVSMAWVPFTTSPSTKQKVAADVLVTMNLEDGSLKSNSLMNVPVASWGANAGSGAGHGLLLRGGDWDDDIASVIKRRAVDGYALDTKTNISLLQRKIYAESSQDLIETWSLLHYSLLGIAQIVMMPQFKQRNQAAPHNIKLPVKVIPTIISYFDSYSSEFRTMGYTDASLELKLQSFEQRGNFEQAAGFALFYSSSLERALRALNASKGSLKTGSCRLAGYMAGTPSAQWASLCHTLSAELKDPYLPLRFLPDAELRNYLRGCAQQLTDEGNIRGLLILGFITPEGVNLLERYVDVFGDFQSAALISLAARSGGAGVVEGKVSNWFENYRNILDQWQLFHERALLDISKSKLYRLASTPATSATRSSHNNRVFKMYTNNTSPNPHTISCSSRVLRHTQKISHYSSSGTAPATSCPHCKKALPRCALCLMHMGVPELQGFEGWFTWCQTCRHGGHAKHVQEWFRAHDGCPVAGCDCSCL